MLTLPSAGREALLREVAGFLASRPQASSGEFTLPMVTAVVRSVRRRQPGM